MSPIPDRRRNYLDNAATARIDAKVLAALGKTDGTNIRFSFSKYNTRADIDAAVDALPDILQP